MNDTVKTLLVTGASSGLGHAFAVAALNAGYRVLGTVRSDAAAAQFEALHLERAHGIVLDVTDFDRIDTVIGGAIEAFGPIDALINNAGYGHEGVLEESSLDELRKQFDVNVFGAVAVIKAVLPSMRERRAGRILNITSVAGQVGLAGVAYYCGSKFALEGISQALTQELAGFGIKVTAVAPGSFRTDWAGRSMVRTPHTLSDYDEVFKPIRLAREQKSGKQIGDPDKAAKALLDLIEADDPPVQLLLGSDAQQLAQGNAERQFREAALWHATTRSTDF